MPKNLVFSHDLPDPENLGKTFRESNLQIQHKIPLGTLVEFCHADQNTSDDGNRIEVTIRTLGRLYVVAHDRDCDGTPLYSLDRHPIPVGQWKELHPNPCLERMLRKGLLTGFPEYSLKVVLREEIGKEPNWEDLWKKFKEDE